MNTGQRSAPRRDAHLICELQARLQAIGKATVEGFEFALTQVEFGEALGLSVVHVNRVLQHLRGERLVTWKGRQVAISDLQRLTAYANFDPGYLHLPPRPATGEAAG